MNKIFKVGLIGCGHIAETYFRGQQYFINFKIIACADIDQKAADKCSKLYNIKSKTVSEILKDNEIEVILNLTNKSNERTSSYCCTNRSRKKS